MRVNDRIHESVSRWKNGSRTAEKYARIKDAFDWIVASAVRRGKFYDIKQIEDVVANSGAILKDSGFGYYDEENSIDRSILDEIVGEFMAGQRMHEERAVLGDLVSVGELFGREYAEQNKMCEMTEATLADVYEKCKQLLSRKVRPDLMGILDDIYLGALAKLRIRSVRVYEDMQDLSRRYESSIDKGLPKKTAELRAVQIREDISQADITFASCRDSIARLRERLDGTKLRGMGPSTKENLEELYMALDKKTAFTEYYRKKAHEHLVRGDVPSANQLAGTFKEMARSLQDDVQKLAVLLDRHTGNRAARESGQSTNEELREKAGVLQKEEEMKVQGLLARITQKHDELTALKAIDNSDDERRRTAYFIDALLKEENTEGGRRMSGIIIDVFKSVLADSEKLTSLSNELREKIEERKANLLNRSYSPDLVAQEKLEADYTKAVRAYRASVQRFSESVGRLNDAYLSLFPEAPQEQ